MLNTARIAKNTIFLYLRMILVLAANFLAVRVLLEVLGVEDYGLFNLIVGFVTLVAFYRNDALTRDRHEDDDSKVMNFMTLLTSRK